MTHFNSNYVIRVDKTTILNLCYFVDSIPPNL